MKPHARVDGARGRQAETQEVARWHASVAPGKTTTAARCTATQRVVALAAAVEGVPPAAFPERLAA
jgi:hypothetical protein